MTTDDLKYMRRAMQLALLGEGLVSPNPMVGAVIVADHRIIGEGYHHEYGGPHAEVNAIRSVADADLHLLKQATIFVTLEPCSHYGKTPPCSKLIINTGIPRVVVGAPDPNPKVNGCGVRMMREAGIEVVEGVLAQECVELNHRFMTAQLLHRPFIQLKWAETADGFMASGNEQERLIISNPESMTLMHRERGMADAIFVGTNTIISDNPGLDCRLWPGKNPHPATFNSPRLPGNSRIMERKPFLKEKTESWLQFFRRLLHDENINSVMVEGGKLTLESLIAEELFDEIRIETSPFTLEELINHRSGGTKPGREKKEERNSVCLKGVKAPSVSVSSLLEKGFRRVIKTQPASNTIITLRRPIYF
ncbi:MAG: bifunctional diaminohydroxyphosphoribosylaminopyrimidine deaminase/5-amino-6-(5-phosphoribosylamino)uracil reductase RibD [Muribaculaceae bacterium]|nr:bifunctional diaminohydroxyphosphoribosylaminopyrimidine deaminase/5-amino-6-(5-phosphoribosylamino)uracil reductase RibD [Muribaculaceae bacterium]